MVAWGIFHFNDYGPDNLKWGIQRLLIILKGFTQRQKSQQWNIQKQKKINNYQQGCHTIYECPISENKTNIHSKAGQK